MRDRTTTQSKNESLWKKRIWWISVGGMAVLSTIRVIIGALEAPADSELRFFLPVFLGFLFVLVLSVTMIFCVWFPGHRRVQHIHAVDANAPVALVGGLTEDGNEVLSSRGVTCPLAKPCQAFGSFGAKPSDLRTYRRASPEAADFPAHPIDNVDSIGPRRASRSDRGVRGFAIRDETRLLHRLDFSIFSPGQLFNLAHSRRRTQRLPSGFHAMLGFNDRSA